jgi:hypothetical protein
VFVIGKKIYSVTAVIINLAEEDLFYAGASLGTKPRSVQIVFRKAKPWALLAHGPRRVSYASRISEWVWFKIEIKQLIVGLAEWDKSLLVPLRYIMVVAVLR